MKLVAALREAISTDLSDAEERQVHRAAGAFPSTIKDGTCCLLPDDMALDHHCY